MHHHAQPQAALPAAVVLLGTNPHYLPLILLSLVPVRLTESSLSSLCISHLILPLLENISATHFQGSKMNMIKKENLAT